MVHIGIPRQLSTSGRRRATVEFAAHGRPFTAPVNTGLPVISGGSIVVGFTVTATRGTWTAYPTPAYTYQWRRNGVAIANAVNQSYVIQLDDLGATLTVTETATNSVNSGSATSVATSVVAAALSAPVLVTGPSIAGLAKEGQTLVLVGGTFSGNPTPVVTRQWFRSGSPVSGAIGTTYALSSSDVGGTFSITVTGASTQGSTSASSASTVPVVAIDAEGAPSTAGTPVGLLLTLTSSGQSGEVGNTPPPDTGGTGAGTPAGLLLTITKAQ